MDIKDKVTLDNIAEISSKSMDKIPRCLVLFESACKSKRTFETYEFLLKKFLEWCNKDHESLLMVPITKLEDLLQDYCMYLKKRIDCKIMDKDGRELEMLSPNSITTYFNPIFRFLKVNRVKIDKESIVQLFPDKVKLGGNDAITTEQLVELVSVSGTKRNKAMIHFFSATGARPEAVCELQLKHLAEYQDGFYKVILYSDDFKHEMITFLNPESVKALEEYFEERRTNGEKLTPESYVFVVNDEYGTHSMTRNVLENMMGRVWKRSGIKRIKTRNRYNLASTTSIRKRFDTILEMNPEVSVGIIQYLMDHTGYLSGTHYRRPTESNIFEVYRVVSAELMISDVLRMELQLKQKDDEIYNNESQKDVRIKELESRAERTEKLLIQLMMKLDSS